MQRPGEGGSAAQTAATTTTTTTTPQGSWLPHGCKTCPPKVARTSFAAVVAQGVSCVLVLVALVVCFSHLFANSSAFANKMGLQRMRTQRTLKEALCARHHATNESWSSSSVMMTKSASSRVDTGECDPRATHRKIVKVQRRFRRRTRSAVGRLVGGDREARDRLNDALDRDGASEFKARLDAYLDFSGTEAEELDAWAALDASGESIVDTYTTAISSLSNVSTAYLWVALLLNVLVFIFTVYLQLKVRAEERRLSACEAEIGRALSHLDARAFEAEVLNHRFGNKIRVNRLLLECGHYDKLKKNFDAWTWEVEIRRGHFDNLPLAPIAATDLFETEFAFPHSLRCFCGEGTPLTFKTLAGDRQLSFAVIQHSFLQDIASNIIKYGGSRADVVVEPDAIVVSNDVVPPAVGLPKTRKTGLVALQRLGEVSGTPISVDKTEHRFTLTIHCRVEPAAAAARSPSCHKGAAADRHHDATVEDDADEARGSSDEEKGRAASSEEEESKHFRGDASSSFAAQELSVDAPPPPPPNGVVVVRREDGDCESRSTREPPRRPDPKAFHWMLLEDSPTICALTAKKVRDRFGIALATLPKASDAHNLVSLVLEAHHLHEKPIILIMDENVVTLNAAHRCVGETSTNLRKTLQEHPDVRRLLAEDQLFFVSASAAEVADDSLLCKVGKTLGTDAQVETILDAVHAKYLAAGQVAGSTASRSSSSSSSSVAGSKKTLRRRDQQVRHQDKLAHHRQVVAPVQ